jgi:hypothetical protein
MKLILILMLLAASVSQTLIDSTSAAVSSPLCLLFHGKKFYYQTPFPEQHMEPRTRVVSGDSF